MNKQRKLVSILAGLMAAIMLLTLLAGILPVSASAAKSSKDIKEEINALKGDRTAIWAELEALESEQDATWESIEELVEQKAQLMLQIFLNLLWHVVKLDV